MWFAWAVLGLKPQAISLRPSRAHYGNVNSDTCLRLNRYGSLGYCQVSLRETLRADLHSLLA